MPVIRVDDQQYSLQRGQNRLGAGPDAEVCVDGDAAIGVQAVIEVGNDDQAFIRRWDGGGRVTVNGIALDDPTPLMHGDKVEVAGHELLYSDDTKAGATQFVSASDLAAAVNRRGGPARGTAATGGRLVSLVDGKEYTIPPAGIAIGRDASCGVVVPQNEVSRRHAEVAPVANGYEIRDLSANGVWVNGTRVVKSQMLSRADVFRVGSEEFRFYADPIAPGAPTAPSAPTASTAHVATAAPSLSPPVIPAPPPKPAVEQRRVFGTLEVMNGGVLKGQRYTVYTALAHVGRGAHNDIVIDDDSVSDTHAKLQRRDDGWYVVDIDSTNGTYVGGQRIHGDRKLEGTSDVRFGGITMTFQPKDTAPDNIMGTRAIAPDRSKLRPARQATPATSLTPPQAAAPIAAAGAEIGEANDGMPMWMWGIIAVAVVVAVGFFFMKR